MKKFTQILIISIFTILIIGGFTKPVFAAPLEVTFSSDPLFKELNFYPSSETTSSIKVSNNSGNPQNIIVEATNAIDNDGLGNKLNFVIKEGNTEIYKKTLGAFLREGEVYLSSLADNSNTNYSFNVIFDKNADNNLQNKSLGFDLCIGFQGGSTRCGNTVISDENGGGNNTNISGSSSSAATLTIFNEQAINIVNTDNSGTATINWNTNKLSTSQVIYGVSPGPYNLNLNTLPNLGYPLGSIEDGNKVMNHSVLLTGLTPGATYVYRVVSHASPATVSYEHQFTIPLPAPENIKLALNNNDGNQILEKEENKNLDDTSSSPDDTTDTKNNNVLGASVLASGIDNILSACSIYGLLILLLIYLIWILWLKKRNENKMVPEQEITNRFCLFFGLSSLFVIAILLLLGRYCPIWIFTISSIISFCFYFYRKFKIK